MANKKISELTAASSLTGTEQVEVNQGGVSKRTTTQEIADSGDYTASQIANVAAGGISATNVQSALNELDTEKATIAYVDSRIVAYGIAISDLVNPLTAGTGKAYFRMPHAMTLTAVRASLQTAQYSGSLVTIDINENGNSILSTKLTIDNNEKTSVTALTQPVISDASLADDAEMIFDVDAVGDGSAIGGIVWLIGTKTV